MMPVLVVLLSAWAGVCAVWALLLVAQFRARRDGLELEPLPADAPPPGGAWPSVSIVIPARNEAAGLEACLRSVLQQDYPALSVVVIDDRSTDATLAAAQRVAQADARVRVKHVASLPAGWLGKSHALWTATRGLDSDWLLFVDVDCRLDPWAVRTTIAEAVRREVALLTLWPRNAAQTFWEHMLIPLCGAVIALWFASREVGRRRGGPPFANGQFLLIRRDVYERIDGHRSVRTAIIEDIPLAERVRGAGGTIHVAAGSRVAAVRMYEDYVGIRDGWARIYVGALRSGAKLVASVVWMLVGNLLPFIAAPVLLAALAMAVTGGGPVSPVLGAAAALCAAHLALHVIVSYRFWGLGGCRRVYLWLYPVSVVVVIRILARAWWWLVVRRRVPWRHTSYRISTRGLIIDRPLR